MTSEVLYFIHVGVFRCILAVRLHWVESEERDGIIAGDVMFMRLLRSSSATCEACAIFGRAGYKDGKFDCSR